jgi:muramoyltetrapeptide carboxypeptidase
MESIIRKPRRLKLGDTIGIVSPGSAPLVEAKFNNGVNYLHQKGFHIKLGENILKRRGYLAGNDESRAADLNAMFADPEVKALFCTRGGYGASRILDKIDYDLVGNNPKIFMGYSDFTALSLSLLKKSNLITFIGPMVATEFGNNISEFTEQNVWNLLLRKISPYRLEHPHNEDLVVLRPGKAEGMVLGGCLSVISGVLGTPYLPNFEGSLLFLEEVGEQPHRVDRYLSQLKLAGILDSINGLIFGQFTDCIYSDSSKATLTIMEILDDYTKDLDIPVMVNFAFGHASQNITLPIGVKAHIDTDQKSIIIIESPFESEFSGEAIL